MRSYYFDYAAATPISKKSLHEFNKISQKFYANPMSKHGLGAKANDILKMYRMRAAKIFNCTPEEIIFTASGTESNTLAISGCVKDSQQIITTPIEHKSVLEPAKFKKTVFVKVDKDGIVDKNDLLKKVTSKTKLVSIIYANNEIGVIQNIAQLTRIVKKKNKNCLVHTDASQSSLLNLDVKKLGVDLLTINSSKCYGPRGVGLLFKKKNVTLFPLTRGGSQEFGLRAGTHNLAGIAGFIVALEQMQKNKAKHLKKIETLRKYFLKTLKIAHYKLNNAKRQHPAIISIGFRNLDPHLLLKYLSDYGIAISTGSACNEGEITRSYVLTAIKAQKEYGFIRISLGITTTKKEVDYLAKKLKYVVDSLNKLN